ncbi:MAG: SDR family NAD(P)-dependent oxidoreductase [Sphingomonadaceae bacterium]|uniref:SDR family NAD(P)-dependent oxidoreductase n=1 Tax=Thermaurantiacus sp. TaxID=2820283 RepID=UPI00298EDF5D|nr:SDR family NAD(P)-dependent oxidoreductase [Thermaurantiacus sp.]MCS6985863.1 SDR family NAD(P)-dependent oxidoreductase [Sphingomonadaceae bacterium]MDW8413868.1 SDR family NAD(P)-dependent oxidoreductase [Thermaurantiacus sp.]
MTKPLALVTGASRGIGAALAVRLAAEGRHVLLAARTEGGLTETDDRVRAAGGSATLAPIDLLQTPDIDRLADATARRWPDGLDLLVLNAAMLGTLSPLAHQPPAEFERVVALNLTAQWHLLRAFDPLLRRAGGAVVGLTSSVAVGGRAYWGAYAAAKAGFEALLGTYADEMKALRVEVLLVDPGPTRTAMRRAAYPGEDPATVKPPEVVAERIAERLAQGLPPGLTRLKLDRAGAVVG